MTPHPSLTDSTLRAMLVRRASRARPSGLNDTIMSTVAGTSQQRRPWLDRPAWLAVPQAQPRLLWAIAMVGLLLALAAGTAIVGSRLRDRAHEVPLDPSGLVPSGLEIVSPDPGLYSQAVVDGEGIVWLSGPGGLTRYDPASATGRTWSVQDDLHFSESWLMAAQAGGVWLISERSLHRFDGTAFREEVDVGSEIAAVTEAPDRSLWAATTDGVLVHLVGSSQVSTRAPNPGPEASIGAIAVDAAGVVWCGWSTGDSPGAAGRVSRFDGSVWQSFDSNDGAPLDGGIQTIATLPDGSLWVATGSGLAAFDGSTWSKVHANELAYPGLTELDSVAVGPNGEIWAAGTPSGRAYVVRYEGGAWTSFHQLDGLPLPDPGWEVIVESAWMVPTKDHVLVGTGTGIYELQGERWQHVWPGPSRRGPDPSSARRGLIALSRDEAWVAEVNLTLGSAWHYAAGRWSESASVEGFLHGPDGALLACADGGTYRLGGSYRLEGTTWRPVAALGDSCALALDGTDGLWVAQPGPEETGWALHSYRFDGQTWTEQTRIKSTDLVGRPQHVATGPDGAIWVGCAGGYAAPSGLVRYMDGTWETVDPRGTGADFVVRDLIVTPNGDLWVAGGDVDPTGGATTGSWIARYDGTRWTTHVPGGMGAYVNLAAGPDGTIWAAGSGGLGRFDGTGWTIRYPGIFFQEVSVAPDGTVWVSTLGGIGRLSTSSNDR